MTLALINTCNVSISNKTTEAFGFLTETIENIELKHRGPLLTNVLKLGIYVTMQLRVELSYALRTCVTEDEGKRPTK